MLLIASTLVLFGAAIFLTKLAYHRLTKPRFPYPPGPRARLLTGNAADFPKNNAGQAYADWGKKFNSDILHASAFGVHVVIINSRKIAEDLFDKRANLYNDRPEIPVIKVMGWELSVAFMRYGDAWRQHRKLCQQNFHSDAAKQYYPIQLERVHAFLREVMREPEKIWDQITMFSVSVTMMMMYGYVPATYNDPVVQAADEALRLGSPLVEHSGTLINIIPFLRHIPSWVPGATGKKTAEKVRWLSEIWQRIPMEHVKTALRDGTALPSLVTNFLENKAATVTLQEESQVNKVAWTVYAAASETITSAATIFLHLMAKHPDIQRRAQEEIDRVVGNDRLPDFNDRPCLPYIDAIYRELLRHTPPLALGLPHVATDDDIYEGYFIPRGAIVIGNIWAMTHDETMYPDPLTFKPERFLDSNGRLNDDSRIMAYGFGRRICVGKSVASATLWLVIASFLSCFNIDKAKDENGNDIEIDEAYVDVGVVTRKKPFKCAVTPRSEEIRKVVECGQ